MREVLNVGILGSESESPVRLSLLILVVTVDEISETSVITCVESTGRRNIWHNFYFLNRFLPPLIHILWYIWTTVYLYHVTVTAHNIVRKSAFVTEWVGGRPTVCKLFYETDVGHKMSVFVFDKHIWIHLNNTHNTHIS